MYSSQPYLPQSPLKPRSLISTLRKGFNTLNQISFSDQKLHQLTRSKRIQSLNKQFQLSSNISNRKHKQNQRSMTMTSTFDEQCPQLADNLRINKSRLQRVKTEVDQLRTYQFNDYIRKCARYQDLLNLNDNKKKHLSTLNAKVGEVVKKSVVQTQAKSVYYQLKHECIVLQGWKPQSRQGHSCVIYKDNAVIIGGHCSHPFSTAQVYSLSSNSWIKQISTQSARSYHSSILYKNRFIITFGGMGNYDMSRKCRGCFNTVNLIDLTNFTTRSLKMHNQESIQARRSHSATLMGKYMIVFAGMNAKKTMLRDLVYLDLKELRWYHKELKIEGKQLTDNMETGIAKHKAIAIFKQRKQLPLYLAQYNEHQGIYVFGGTYGNGQQNIVLQISFNKYIPCLKRIQYQGSSPSCVDPILCLLNQQVLIISGNSKSREICLFRPQQKQFIQISNSESKNLGGIGSTITNYGDDYYVFFGLGHQGYIGTVGRFKIEEKLKERDNKKRKILKGNQEIADWREFNWEIKTQSEF